MTSSPALEVRSAARVAKAIEANRQPKTRKKSKPSAAKTERDRLEAARRKFEKTRKRQRQSEANRRNAVANRRKVAAKVISRQEELKQTEHVMTAIPRGR